MKVEVLQNMPRKPGLRIAANWSYTGKMIMESQFADITSSSKFLDVVLFLLSSLVTGTSFTSISSMVSEL